MVSPVPALIKVTQRGRRQRGDTQLQVMENGPNRSWFWQCLLWLLDRLLTVRRQQELAVGKQAKWETQCG